MRLAASCPTPKLEGQAFILMVLDGAWLGTFYVITDVIDKESYSNAPCIRPGATRLVIGRASFVGSPQKRFSHDPQSDSAQAAVAATRGLQCTRQASLVQVCIHVGLVFVFCCRGARRVKLVLARMEWSNEDIFTFIELYKSEPVIWNPKNVSHSDRHKVHSAWERIKEGLEETGKQFSVKQLKTKKDALMATFRKLSQRVRQSMKTGSGIDEVYRPDWIFFDTLAKFLSVVYLPRKPISSQDAAKPQPQTSVDHDSGKSRSIQKAGEPAPKRTRRKDSEVDENRDSIRTVNTQNSKRDEFSIFGEHVAFKLRNLKDRRSQSIAQFEISSILFQIEMGNFRNLTHFNSNNVSPAGVQAPYLGTAAAQIPSSTNYSTLSPVVLLQSASSQVPVSASPPPQVPKGSPQSVHSNCSVAEDTETKSENYTVTMASTAGYTEDLPKPTDHYILA